MFSKQRKWRIQPGGTKVNCDNELTLSNAIPNLPQLKPNTTFLCDNASNVDRTDSILIFATSDSVSTCRFHSKHLSNICKAFCSFQIDISDPILAYTQVTSFVNSSAFSCFTSPHWVYESLFALGVDHLNHWEKIDTVAFRRKLVLGFVLLLFVRISFSKSAFVNFSYEWRPLNVSLASNYAE